MLKALGAQVQNKSDNRRAILQRLHSFLFSFSVTEQTEVRQHSRDETAKRKSSGDQHPVATVTYIKIQPCISLPTILQIQGKKPQNLGVTR